MNGARAAKVAGYSYPNRAAAKLMDPEQYPLVVEATRKALAEKEAKATKKADDILRYIHTAMFCEPLKFFEPGENGGWLIGEEVLRDLPPEVGCLIEEVERYMVKVEKKILTGFRVKLVSKTAMTGLAARHQLGEKVAVTQTIDWDAPARELERKAQEPDPIEAKIASVLAKPANEQARPVNRLGYDPSSNGDGHQ